MSAFEEPGNGCSQPAAPVLDERLKARHSATRQSPTLGPVISKNSASGRTELRRQLFPDDSSRHDQPLLYQGKSDQSFSLEAFLSRSHVLAALGILTLLTITGLAFRQSYLEAGESSLNPIKPREAAASGSSLQGDANKRQANDRQPRDHAKAQSEHSRTGVLPQQKQLAGAAECLKEALAKQLKQEGLQESLTVAETNHRAHLLRRKMALKKTPVTSWEDAWSRILVPTYSCPREVRLGPWGPGGWWVCQINKKDRKLLSPTKAEAQTFSNISVVVSAGGVTDGSFEKQLSASLGKGSTTHVVDKLSSASGDGMKLLQKELTGSKYKKRMANKAKKQGDNTDKIKAMISLDDLLSALGGQVSVFKLDCDSCEAGVVEDMQRLSTTETPLFEQVLMTLHRATNVDVIRAVVSGLEALGYRMFHAEPEVKTRAGFRVSFIHESLVTPGEALESSSIGLCQPRGVFGGDKRKWRSLSSCLSQSTQQLQVLSSMKWALRRSQRSFSTNLKQRKGGLRALQGKPIKDRRELESLLLVPLYPCAQEERLGTWGEGGKWVCLTHLNSLEDKWSPKVVSVGHLGDGSFEEDIFKRFGSRTDVFDLSLDEGTEKTISSIEYIHFQRLGLTGSASVNSLNKKQPGKWIDLQGLVKTINAGFVDILRVDCEGCETDLVKDLLRITKRASPLFGQILMELHDLEDAGATAGLLLSLEGLGYRMFHAEAVGYCRSCYEVAFIHESLVNAKAKELHLNSDLVLPSVKACLVSTSL